MVKRLSEVFNKYEASSKILLSGEPKTQREAKLQGNVKISVSLFLQDYKPTFKVLTTVRFIEKRKKVFLKPQY